MQAVLEEKELVDTLNGLLDKFNVYQMYRDEIFQELAVAWLEGNQDEFKLKSHVIYYFKRNRKYIPSSQVIEYVVSDVYFDEEDKTFILNFLSKAVEEGLITLHQCNILYKHILGDSEYLIAKHLKISQPTVHEARHRAITNLRRHWNDEYLISKKG